MINDDVKEGKFYNGTVIGIDGWSGKAIAGRGVLIDYASWIREQNISYDAMGRHAISAEDIKTIMVAKNIRPRQGYILIMRTGYVPKYMRLSTIAKDDLKTASHSWPGLKQDESMARWLWKRQFAAIATDNPGLDPLDEDWQLHPILPAGWGTPIVELFDLEVLAEVCQRRKRWTFFFTSVPLNYKGVVASPPNAMALF
ncbi:hypothetical protein ZTR_00840 [Talaromyces verruculosus]|nr:hypothetical protein ZTR_00840 [Talaromyces verruculosus]